MSTHETFDEQEQARYDAAREIAADASRAYAEVQRQYRAREIDDEQYLAGRKAYTLAMRTFDIARGEVTS